MGAAYARVAHANNMPAEYARDKDGARELKQWKAHAFALIQELRGEDDTRKENDAQRRVAIVDELPSVGEVVHFGRSLATAPRLRAITKNWWARTTTTTTQNETHISRQG